MQFFHIGRGCLGGQPRHMVGAVCLGAGDSLWCSFSLPGWGRVRVGRGPEGDFGVVFPLSDGSECEPRLERFA